MQFVDQQRHDGVISGFCPHSGLLRFGQEGVATPVTVVTRRFAAIQLRIPLHDSWVGGGTPAGRRRLEPAAAASPAGGVASGSTRVLASRRYIHRMEGLDRITIEPGKMGGQ